MKGVGPRPDPSLKLGLRGGQVGEVSAQQNSAPFPSEGADGLISMALELWVSCGDGDPGKSFFQAPCQK